MAGGGGGLLDNVRVSNHKNYRVLDKDIHPRYTPLIAGMTVEMTVKCPRHRKLDTK